MILISWVASGFLLYILLKEKLFEENAEIFGSCIMGPIMIVVIVINLLK